MKLPDLSDDAKMALIGRQTVLRRAKKDALQKLRDVVVPMLNTGPTQPRYAPSYCP